MAWQSLGSFTLTSQWKFTSNVTGEIFRIKHSPILELAGERPRAVIAQSFTDEQNELNTFDTRVLSYREEIDCFTFYINSGCTGMIKKPQRAQRVQMKEEEKEIYIIPI